MMHSRFSPPQIREATDEDTPDSLRELRPAMPISVAPTIALVTRDAVLCVVEDRDLGCTSRSWEVSVFARSNAFEGDRVIHFSSRTEVRDGDAPRQVGEAFALEVIAVIATAIEEAEHG
jgi:hypothetical protein